jgi:hypothetical protein
MYTLHNKATRRSGQSINYSRHLPSQTKKKSVVKQIYKNGTKEDANNYRLITFVPTLSKVLEKVIANQLIAFLEKQNILNQSQFGFRKNKSTNDATATTIENIIGSLIEKKNAIVCY